MFYRTTAIPGSRPFTCRSRDNQLDNRPALVSRRAGELTIIGSSDGRRQFHRIERNSSLAGMDPNVAGATRITTIFMPT